MFQGLISRRAFYGIANIAFSYATKNNVSATNAFARCLCTADKEQQLGPTIGEVIEKWTRQFESEKVPEPLESISHIVAHIIGTTKIMDVRYNRHRRLSAEETDRLTTMCEFRMMRMPVQYIIGEWDFRDITLRLIPPVFIPRPETEILVDIVLKRLNDSQGEISEILEVGCGSGAISLALAHGSQKVQCVAIDTSLEACDVALENRRRLNLDDKVRIVYASLEEDGTIRGKKHSKECENHNAKTYDFIVSNPPYIPTNKISDLAAEIRIYEDPRAYDGGKDGMKVIKPLLKYAATALKSGGRLFVEVDPGQPEYIEYFTKNDFDSKLHLEHTYKDYCNNDRFVEILKLPA